MGNSNRTCLYDNHLWVVHKPSLRLCRKSLTSNRQEQVEMEWQGQVFQTSANRYVDDVIYRLYETKKTVSSPKDTAMKNTTILLKGVLTAQIRALCRLNGGSSCEGGPL